MSTWQPMSTAPKDYTPILLAIRYYDGEPFVITAHWDCDDFSFIAGNSTLETEATTLAWMPLPVYPSPSTTKGEA